MTSPFSSLLVPLDGSSIAARALGCAAWVADRLGATLHVLSATDHEWPAREALEQLNVPARYWSSIVLHQAPTFPEEAILEAIQRHDIGLVIMTARGEAAESGAEGAADPLKTVGHVTRKIIEASPAPVLLLPAGYRESLPWDSVLVPLSGEVEADEALAVAVRFANSLGLSIHVAHVAQSLRSEGHVLTGGYADAPHHEQPARLAELVRQAVPGCAPEECRCISDVTVCRGDTAAELLQLIERRQVDLVVVGWHGRFARGHANVLKQLVGEARCAILLVKAVPPQPFRLNVGDELS